MNFKIQLLREVYLFKFFSFQCFCKMISIIGKTIPIAAITMFKIMQILASDSYAPTIDSYDETESELSVKNNGIKTRKTTNKTIQP